MFLFVRITRSSYLETELGPPPVPALAVVLNGAVGLEAAPLGKGPVLLGGLGENLLHPESLLGRHIIILVTVGSGKESGRGGVRERKLGKRFVERE
jgi:hypothetical protein